VPAEHDLIGSLRVEAGSAPRLADRNPGLRVGAPTKQAGLERLLKLVDRLSTLHDRLFAESVHAVLLVLQGLDTAGKDGTIRHVLTGANPQGFRVVAFREPTGNELAHDYLWRVHAVCPARGELGVFNRSHYEDVVAARVRGLVPKHVWKRRFEHIRGFERMLVDEGTEVIKVFLHVSREEQLVRLKERLDNPEKRWKFRRGDLDDRRLWGQFMEAYEDAIRETSTDWAPWYVIPADHNWVRNLAVAEVLVSALERLDSKLPEPDPGLDASDLI
jgi:PPK2 family polyphosphate:nucleotide phosphotransferase